MDLFATNKSAKDGKRSICKECDNKRGRGYYQKNKEHIRKRTKIYQEENKEHLAEKAAEWFQRNKKRVNERIRKRVKKDPLYGISRSTRSLISQTFRRNGYSKNTKTAKILGCSFEEFKQHLESQFEDWMTWENRGLYNGELNYGWDIDHIIPVSSATTEEEVIKLNHYTNLQPLCSRVNRDIKRDKLNE